MYFKINYGEKAVVNSKKRKCVFTPVLRTLQTFIARLEMGFSIYFQ